MKITSLKIRKSILVFTIIIGTCAGIIFIGCESDDPITDTVYFTDIEADQVKLGGAPLLIPAYAELYLTGAKTVNCAVKDVYYIVDGPSTTGEILGFVDNGASRLTYTDVTPDRYCLITTSVTISLPVASRPAIISMKIYKNGVADDASLVGNYIGTDDVAASLPIMCLMVLQPDDYIEVYVSAASANKTVVVNTMTLVATTVD
jgi:hypothetical protein